MDKEIIYEIKPKFNLIYELFMPTGRKIKNALAVFLVCLICLLVFKFIVSNTETMNTISQFKDVDLIRGANLILLALTIIVLLKLVIHIVFEIMQYSSITYTFYNDHLEYKDSFLNQHKKIMQYCNIKEIEIIRNIFDRIMGYGTIIIHTNAENENSNGLILYSIKNPQEVYKTIDNIIHKKV